MHSYNATLHSSQEALAQDQAVQATANQKLNLTSIGYVNAIAKKNADIVQINNEMQSLSDAKIAAADKLDKATLACPGLCTCPAVLEVSAGSACTTGTPVAIAGKTYGTKYTILKQGSGVAVATPKTEVSALVVGTLESGKVFWNSSNPLAGPHGTYHPLLPLAWADLWPSEPTGCGVDLVGARSAVCAVRHSGAGCAHAVAQGQPVRPVSNHTRNLHRAAPL
jgi:hypothetical protein